MVINHHPNARLWALGNLLQECSDLWLVYDNVRAMYLCLVSATSQTRAFNGSQPLSHNLSFLCLQNKIFGSWRCWCFGDITSILMSPTLWVANFLSIPKLERLPRAYPLNKVHLWQCFGTRRRLSSNTPNGNVLFTIVGIHFGVPEVPFSWSLPWLGDGYVCIIG